MRKARIVTAVALGAVLSASPLVAIGQGATTSQTGHERMMDIPEIIATLEQAGYTRVDEIEREFDRYDVTAINSEGHRMELEVDASTGRVLRSEPED